MRRDTFLKSMAALVVVGALPVPATAATNVKIMVPASPGGGWDLIGRSLGKALQESGAVSSVTYENKGGGTGAIGLAQFVNTSKGDPSALMVMGSLMLGGLITGRPAVSLTQATPLARLTTEYTVFVVPENSQLKTMADVVDQMKKDIAGVKWGGAWRGSNEHIAAAMIAREIGVDPAKINYVPYRVGGEAGAAILGGHVTVGVSGHSEFAQYIESGKMKVLAVSAPSRLKGLNAPTLKEQGIDVEIGNWRGVYGAPAITTEQRNALIAMVVKATESKVWVESLEKNNWTPALLAGPKFEQFVDREFARLRATMVKAGMV
jgi:putative tricarboxylic transport membrane protein